MKSLTILEPISLGTETIPNRFGLAPISTGFVDQYGMPTDDFTTFHSLYARQGIALIFVGGIAVSSQGRVSNRTIALDSIEKARILSHCVTSIRNSGSVPIIQLMHAGRQAYSTETGQDLVAPSAVACPIVGVTPRQLTKDEIANIVDDFLAAAQLAIKAKATLVELHAAHGYLLASFLSPYSNFRGDDYGGSLFNRFRIIREIAEGLKSKSIVFGIRISADEFVQNGLSGRDLSPTCKLVEEIGCAYLSISAGVYSKSDRIMPHRSLGEGIYRPLARAAKTECSLPIMIAGNITSVLSASEIIQSGDADLALLGRALLSDPYLLEKSINGRPESVVPCAMTQLCKYHSRKLPHIVCPHNPELKWILNKTITTLRDSGVSTKAAKIQ